MGLTSAHASKGRALADRDIAQLEPTDGWRLRGSSFVEECEAYLWSGAGERARAYLHGRCLTDQTLRRWHVGFQPRERLYEPALRWGLPAGREDGGRAGVWLPRGIVLPWFADGKLWHLKVRTAAANPDSRFRAVRGGHPWVYDAGNPDSALPLLIVEAELCAQLVWQEARDLVHPVSLGGCRRTLTPRVLERLDAGPVQFVGYDADSEGDRGSEHLLEQFPRGVRVRPPLAKDPTAYAQAGGSVRDWLIQATACQCETRHTRAQEMPTRVGHRLVSCQNNSSDTEGQGHASDRTEVGNGGAVVGASRLTWSSGHLASKFSGGPA
jgi:hypothetical protein